MYLKHFKTRILLELIKSKISPTILSINSLSLIKALFEISLKAQLHIADISSKLIPSYWQPSSHKETLG